MVRPVPVTSTGRPSAVPSSAPGAHGSAMYRSLSGIGRVVAGGRLPVASTTASASSGPPAVSRSRSGRSGPAALTSVTSVTAALIRLTGRPASRSESVSSSRR